MKGPLARQRHAFFEAAPILGRLASLSLCLALSIVPFGGCIKDQKSNFREGFEDYGEVFSSRPRSSGHPSSFSSESRDIDRSLGVD